MNCPAPTRQPPNLPSNPPPPTSPPLTPHLFPASLATASTTTTTESKNVSLRQSHKPPIVPWTSAIGRHCRNGDLSQAMKEFTRMRLSDIEPNHITFITLLSGCAHFPSQGQFLGGSIHAYVRKLGLDRDNVRVGTAVVDMYSKYYVTIIAVLSACANLGALNLGLWINRFVMGKEFGDNIRLSNTLIDMYSRCGRVDFARQIFEQMPSRTLVSWNSMIGGFAANGHVEEALKFFDRMKMEGFKPDGVSFTGALTACSHAGLVAQGLQFFDEMQRVHKISPRIEHYGCLVDLYSRAGRLEDAMTVIKNMPIKPNEVVLGSLLAACRNCGDVGLAEMLMKYLLKLDRGSASNYVLLLAHMYAAAGSWDGAGKVRRKMKTQGIEKRTGVSSIEISDSIHEFISRDKSHPETDSIYTVLDLLSYELGMYGCLPDATTQETQDNYKCNTEL
ncbi:hypothetical protein Cgig2_022462 [Carnegiea gigantea]|uniref:Pentatricopeptide repeat-containing protein n=1 Tax=Carnegiea gigantea TaxID=171969 RepID=A0A9Q1K9F5_9CARY|nr:hypothetical protein Cgig2_022462 [Carnegiea gigantea]